MLSETNYDLELFCLDKALNTDVLLKYIYLASSPNISRLCVQSSLIGWVRNISKDLDIASIIDYPDGLSSKQSRVADVIYSIRSGAKFIDIVINNVLVANGEWKQIREEIKSLYLLTRENKVKLRAVIEHSLHDFEVNKSLVDILVYGGVDSIVVSTGRLAYDSELTLTFCKKLEKQSAATIIVSDRIYSKNSINPYIELGITHFRVNSLSAAENIIARG